ncbi:hypothetical protein HDV06_001665 [Boothiomyces sp. JEL0866]|nr:hypothetical protein HDV06_001665 [Boothiomyces sp. JEL0866]
MTFFKQSQTVNLNLVDLNNNHVLPRIDVVPKKGIWCKDDVWNCYKRNQFQLSVSIVSSPHLFYQSTPITKYKIEISCTNVLDTNKLYVQQKTKRGVERVTPVYLPVDSTSKITIPKLQFNRSTPSNKNRNLTDSYFQLIVCISAVTVNELEIPMATFTSENLNVLSCTPSQYDYERNSRSKSSRKYSTESFAPIGEHYEFAYQSPPADYNQTPPPEMEHYPISFTPPPTIVPAGSLSPISNELAFETNDISFSKRTSVDLFADLNIAKYDPIDSMVFNFLMEPFCNYKQ